jgi:outer membrane protein assembly factor BamB
MGKLILIVALACPVLFAKDQPQWGHAWTRNMTSPERNLPATFDPKTGENIKWVAKIGNESHSTPIIADGRVYIGTNNDEPRNPKHQGDRGVLMCFDEQTGKFLWQLVVPKLSNEDPYYDWPKSGIASAVTVERDRVYVVSNRAEVLCLDPEGMANGNNGPFKDEACHHAPQPTNAPPTESIPVDETDGDILWAFDMRKDAGIWPHDGAHSSILISGEFIYVNTGTGVDNTHRKIRTPDAPSLIVLAKRTGRLVARDRENIAPNIFHSTWSSPSTARIHGKNVIFFAGGNGILYAFEALTHFPEKGEVATLKKIWQFDPDPSAPKTEVHRYTTNRREGPSNIYGMPVYYDQRLYFTGGGDLWWGKNEAWLKCINFFNPNAANRWPEAVKTGDITDTALVWNYPLEKHTMSTPAISGDLIFVSDNRRLLHCVDRKTGKPYWTHELTGEMWASPYIADNKVYIGSRRGDVCVFELSPKKKLLATVDFGVPISGTVTAANGTIFIATMRELYAIAQGASSEPQ